MKSSKIKAVIFDMDGVLIDAKDWHYEALNKALEFFGLAISRYDHLTTYDGFPTRKKLEMLSIEKSLPRGLHSFIAKMKQQYTVEAIQTRCKPNFVHQYALSRLKKEGYQMAVCSNSIRQTITLMLEKAELIKYIEFFISNEEVKNFKPDPEMYITAMNKLGLKPQECLIVEDNRQGLKAAKESKAHVLEVKDTVDANYENIRHRIDEIDLGGKP